MHEQEAHNDRDAQKPDSPPKLKRPRSIRRDKGGESWTSNTSEVQAPMERSEGTTSLVQEKEVNEDSWTEDTSDTSKESREESRDDETVELILVGHLSCPDLGKKTCSQSPEDGGAATELEGHWGEEKASSRQTG